MNSTAQKAEKTVDKDRREDNCIHMNEKEKDNKPR